MTKTQCLGQLARAIGEVSIADATPSESHLIDAGQWSDGSDQHRRCDTRATHHDVRTPVHAVAQIDVPVTGRPKHELGPWCRPTPCMTARIILAAIGLDFDDSSTSVTYHQHLMQEVRSDLEHRTIVKPMAYIAHCFDRSVLSPWCRRARLVMAQHVRYLAAVMHVSTLDAEPLRRVLDQSPVASVEGATAAVAVVFRGGEHGTELLFIQRATKDTDPWSGHMAFPGGRTDPGDVDAHATAERETLEEVGLDLRGVARLGSLSNLVPGRHLQAVHAQAYWLQGPRPRLTPNYEVADTIWVPLSDLADKARFIDYYYPLSDSTWPGIQLDIQSQVVWGLTLRFLADLFDRLDHPFIELAPWP